MLRLAPLVLAIGIAATSARAADPEPKEDLDGKVPEARHLTGRAALGAHIDGGPLGMALSFKYWVSDLGVQVFFAASPIDGTDTTVGFFEYRPAVRGLYALTRTRKVNLYVGVGLTSRLRAIDEAPDSDTRERPNNAAFFDVLLGIEHFIGPRFAIAGHLTLSVELGGDPDRALFASPWGGSFHFYF